MGDLRVLLISSVVPRDTTAAEVLLFRHFSQCSDVQLTIATDCETDYPSETIISLRSNSIIEQFTKTRFAQVAHSIRHCFNTVSHTALDRYLNQHKPDLILTIAHGELCWLAQKIAKQFNIPLVTFFHDWLPDCAYVHPWINKTLTQRFKRLYQQSQLAFCVSPQMQHELGVHANAQVLYPVPAQRNADLGTPIQAHLPAVVYAGNLSDIYGPMLRELAFASQHAAGWQLKLFGLCPDWSTSDIERLQNQGVYGGFLSKNALMETLNQAIALLVVMSFDPSHRRRMQTSFPSKLVEYCKFGKPIVVWGPETCSAVQWGQIHQAALTVTSPQTQDVVAAIQQLMTQPKTQQQLSHNALKMAQTMFDPQTIQQQFINGLYKTALKSKDANRF